MLNAQGNERHGSAYRGEGKPPMDDQNRVPDQPEQQQPVQEGNSLSLIWGGLLLIGVILLSLYYVVPRLF